MESQYERNIFNLLTEAGFTKNLKIASTLQGQIWKSYQKELDEEFVIKVTSKKLHKSSSIIVNGKTLEVKENIIQETKIMEKLSALSNCPSSIIKYKGFFKSSSNYYLMMESGGFNLFDFIKKSHRLIRLNMVDMFEWHETVKIIFKQMIEAVEFMHKHNVAHFDISLENTLINDVSILIINANTQNEKIEYEKNEIQIKIIDFGLAEQFGERDGFKSNKYVGKRNYQCPEIVSQKTFNADSNDVFCLGVCLFMMISGTAPFYKAHKSDNSYKCIINGHLKYLLCEWEVLSYFDDDLLDLMTKILKLEDKRISLDQIKQHKWLSNVH